MLCEVVKLSIELAGLFYGLPGVGREGCPPRAGSGAGCQLGEGTLLPGGLPRGLVPRQLRPGPASLRSRAAIPRDIGCPVLAGRGGLQLGASAHGGSLGSLLTLMAAWSGLCFCSRVYLRPCRFVEEKLLFSLVKICLRPRVPTQQALARPLLIGGQEEGEDSLSLTFRSHPG